MPSARILQPCISLLIAFIFSSCTSLPVQEIIHHHSSQPVHIVARTYWNDTGITLHAGHRYQLHITGTWNDWFSKATPNGPACPLLYAAMFPLRPLLRFSPCRDRRANYFQPIGTIGRREGKKLPTHAFIIQDGMIYNAPATGILHVFANDAPWEITYKNNSGQLRLTVIESP